jgi:hypothetical protein
VVWFAQAIKALHKSRGFDIVLKKVKQTDRPDFPFYEAVSLLLTADIFQQSGHRVQFEPEIAEFTKKPDLMVTDLISGKDTVVEVTELTMTKDEIKSSLMHQAITHPRGVACLSFQVPHYCRRAGPRGTCSYRS